MDNSPTAPEKRRRRPPLACIACRRRKVRCDRKLPCQNCVRARRATSCAYVPDERIEPRDGGPGFNDGINGPDPQHDDVVSAPYLSPTASHNSTSNVSPEQLADRVRQLERQLNEVLDARNEKRTSQPQPPRPPNADAPTASKFLGPEHWQIGSLGTLGKGVQASSGGFKQDANTGDDSSSAVNANAILAKSRYLGNSHWIHGVTLVSIAAPSWLPFQDIYWKSILHILCKSSSLLSSSTIFCSMGKHSTAHHLSVSSITESLHIHTSSPLL